MTINGQRILGAVGIVWAAILAAPAGVWAAEAEGEGWGWLGTAGRWFNLAIIVGLLAFALRKSLPLYFQKRRQSIQDEIQEATRVRQEAEAKLEEVQSRLASLDSELENIRQEARRNAEAEGRRLLEEARADGEKIIAAAEREVDNLRRHAREELREYASQLALDLAEEQIRKSIGEDDETRVVNRFFEQLSDSGKG